MREPVAARSVCPQRERRPQARRSAPAELGAGPAEQRTGAHGRTRSVGDAAEEGPGAGTGHGVRAEDGPFRSTASSPGALPTRRCVATGGAGRGGLPAPPRHRPRAFAAPSARRSRRPRRSRRRHQLGPAPGLPGQRRPRPRALRTRRRHIDSGCSAVAVAAGVLPREASRWTSPLFRVPLVSFCPWAPAEGWLPSPRPGLVDPAAEPSGPAAGTKAPRVP